MPGFFRFENYKHKIGIPVIRPFLGYDQVGSTDVDINIHNLKVVNKTQVLKAAN